MTVISSCRRSSNRMTELTDLTIAAARAGLREKSFSALELTQAHLSAIEAANEALNAYVLKTPELALEMAKASDARLKKGEGGPLEGIPLGIKDLFCTKDVRSTACSHILDGFTPTYESTVTANLWAEGAVMLGKLNNDEFAMGSSNETSFYGPVVNPWRRKGSDAKLVPAGRAAGHQLGVGAFAAPRIDHRTIEARLVGRPHGELVIVELAEHHRAFRPQIGGDRRLIGRREAVENMRAGRAANVLRAEQILDAERNAFQRSALAFGKTRIACSGHFKRALGRRQHVGVELSLIHISE